MKSIVPSLSGAVALSFIHLLLELWRGFLDFSLVLPEFSGESVSSLALYAAVYTVIFAAWLLALGSARSGNRRGIIWALVLGALFWVGLDWGTIFLYCPGGCEQLIFDITTYAALIVGGLAIIGFLASLRTNSKF